MINHENIVWTLKKQYIQKRISFAFFCLRAGRYRRLAGCIVGNRQLRNSFELSRLELEH